MPIPQRTKASHLQSATDIWVALGDGMLVRFNWRVKESRACFIKFQKAVLLWPNLTLFVLILTNPAFNKDNNNIFKDVGKICEARRYYYEKVNRRQTGFFKCSHSINWPRQKVSYGFSTVWEKAKGKTRSLLFMSRGKNIEYWSLLECDGSLVKPRSRLRQEYVINIVLAHWGRDKWTPFSRRHFQMHFLEWKCINFV